MRSQVEAFIKEQVSLTDIALINGRVLDTMHQQDSVTSDKKVHADSFSGHIKTLEDILTIDKLARIQAQQEVEKCRS